MKRRVKKGCLSLLVVLLALVGIALAVVFYQAKRTPQGRPDYVALGSSFAAGAGLGKLEKGSPLICARSVNGYPQQLARMEHRSIVDMSCGGAKTTHLLNGGQFFQGPQIRTIDRRTRLVTITVGGNDIGYVGDMSLLAARHSHSAWGWLVRHFWSGPTRHRNWTRLETELVATIRAIHAKSPNATVVVATYPTILPTTGTCERISLSSSEADLMRAVGERFAAVSRAAAWKGGAIFVDMHKLGSAHDACSMEPWTNGYSGIAPFHPTLLGAKATASAIASKLSKSPAGVATVR